MTSQSLYKFGPWDDKVFHPIRKCVASEIKLFTFNWISPFLCRVMKVGKKLRDSGKDIYFAVSNQKDFSYELGEFGLNDVKGDKPVVCARDDRDLKYVMSSEFR